MDLVMLMAMLKLASAYHVPIPTITKEVDGTKIDINVEVDIDTGDTVSGEKIPKGRNETVTTSTPSSHLCVPKGMKCHAFLDNCCDDIECFRKNPRGSSKVGICGKPELPEPSTKKPEECLPMGSKCYWNPKFSGATKCCDDFECLRGVFGNDQSAMGICGKWAPPKPSTQKPDDCMPKGMRCDAFLDKCCDDMECIRTGWGANKWGKCDKPALPEPSTQKPEKCLPMGMKCIQFQSNSKGLYKCCDDLECLPDDKIPFLALGRCGKPAPPKPSTQKPEECVPKGMSCFQDDKCCKDLICFISGNKLEGTCEYDPNEKPSTKKPEECVPSGPCTTSDECCDNMICHSRHGCIPWTIAPQCKKAGESCAAGTTDPKDQCCPNHLCDLDNHVCRRVSYRSLSNA